MPEFTAAGTVRELHPIPFSSGRSEASPRRWNSRRGKNTKNFPESGFLRKNSGDLSKRSPQKGCGSCRRHRFPSFGEVPACRPVVFGAAAFVMVCAGVARIGDPAGQIGRDDLLDRPVAAADDGDTVVLEYVFRPVAHVAGEHHVDAHGVQARGDVGFTAAAFGGG